MIVIADTSPINYLIRIGSIDVLPALYGSVLVPPSVRDELRGAAAPEEVKKWIVDPPAWLVVQAPNHRPDEALLQAGLDAGELDAILLAEELGADELIIDELSGRREANQRHLHVIGTLGVLRRAASKGLVDFKQALGRLRATNFRITQEIIDRLLEDNG